jgi:hypothetical protein
MNALRRYLVIVAVMLFLFGGCPAIVLLYVGNSFGASATLAQLAGLQMKKPEAIILPFDLRYNGAFKLYRVEQERPEVICISSSRAGTLRASMFQPYRFYNMSFTAWTTEQLTDIFERATRNVRPRIAIISIDYFLFTDIWEKSYSGTRTMIFDQPLRYLKSSLSNFIKTAAQHPVVFQDYLKEPGAFVGTQAILGQEGFRNDGSYVYSPGHINDARLHYQTAASLVGAMPGAPSMSKRQKAPLSRLSELAQQRGIKLVALQLPFIRAGVNYLDHDDSYRYYSGVWRDFESESTRDWLKGLGIAFFDLGRWTIDDEGISFVDAYHTSDLGALKVMQKLLTYPEFRGLFPAINPAQIEQRLDNDNTTSATSIDR